MYTDPIADMLTRIRNAQKVRKAEVLLPFSSLKFRIAEILQKAHYLGAIEKITAESKTRGHGFDLLKINLLYENGQPKITHLKRISKPGRRVYVTKENIPTILNNYGLAILSTPKGLLTNHQAKKENTGGEIICEIY
ncbi:MAG TPA: 30S ribosomal protein S8 [bacterium]|nr:30S ribosomal protein S8 [bacterium]HPL95892.1 30S ribosomal protein S8 [bacterium]